MRSASDRCYFTSTFKTLFLVSLVPFGPSILELYLLTGHLVVTGNQERDEAMTCSKSHSGWDLNTGSCRTEPVHGEHALPTVCHVLLFTHDGLWRGCVGAFTLFRIICLLSFCSFLCGVCTLTLCLNCFCLDSPVSSKYMLMRHAEHETQYCP